MIDERANVDNERLTKPNVAVEKVGALARISTFLLGNDVFISYSRADAAAYALALANELTKQNLTCYLDQWNAPPGETIPAAIKTALKRSSMLVIIGTCKAARSAAVGEEITEFLKTGRPILPISFAGSVLQANWYPSIKGLALTDETSNALRLGKPSEPVISRVVNAEGFTRRDKRLRRIFLFTALGIVGLVLAGVIISWGFRADAQKQQKLSSANLLSSKAFNLQARQPDLALLLAIESYRITNEMDPDLTTEAKSGLFELLLRSRNISSFLHGDEQKPKEQDMCVAFSANGEKIAAGNFDGSVSIWDVNTKKPLTPPAILNHTTITSLAFSKDGSLLATGRGDGTITLWNEKTKEWKEFASEEIDSPNSDISYGISALAFSPDAKTLVFGRCGKEDERDESVGGGGCVGAELLFLEIESKPLKLSFLPNQHQSAPTSLTFSPDGKTMVSSSAESISFWEASSRKPLRQVTSRGNGRISSVAFGKDNKIIAAGHREDSIVVWNLDTDELLTKPLIGHDGSINGIALSPNGVMVASVGDDRNAILWDTSSYGVANVFLTNTKTETIAVSPDQKLLATGADGTLNVWSIPEKKLFMSSLKGHTQSQRSIAFSPDSKWLASPANESGVLLWDLTSQQKTPRKLDGKHDFVWRVSFSSDGKILASANDDGTVSLWDLTSFKESVIKLSASVYHLDFSPDNKALAMGTQDGEVVILDLATSKQEKLPLRDEQRMRGMAFSPDGNKLAVSLSGDPQNIITLWDFPSRKLLRSPLTVNDDFGGGMAFNRDSSMFAWVDRKGIVKLWDVVTNQLLARIPAGDFGIDQNLAFMRDGKLATYDQQGTVLFWDWNINTMVSKACQIANRSLTTNERAEYSVQSQNNDLCGK